MKGIKNACALFPAEAPRAVAQQHSCTPMIPPLHRDGDFGASPARPNNGQVAVEGTKELKNLPWSFKGDTQDVRPSP